MHEGRDLATTMETRREGRKFPEPAGTATTTSDYDHTLQFVHLVFPIKVAGRCTARRRQRRDHHEVRHLHTKVSPEKTPAVEPDWWPRRMLLIRYSNWLAARRAKKTSVLCPIRKILGKFLLSSGSDTDGRIIQMIDFARYYLFFFSDHEFTFCYFYVSRSNLQSRRFA